MSNVTACFAKSLPHDDLSTGVFSNSADLSTNNFPHAAWYMTPKVSSFEEMLSIIGDGGAKLDVGTCSTTINKKGECQQACTYKNQYSFLAI